jgi:REP element-mobilizing transposase RayT
MTNHIHIIASAGMQIQPNESQSQPNRILIGDIMRDFKKFTSKSIVKAIQDYPQESRREWLLDRCWFRGNNDRKISQFKLWQDGYYSEEITSYDFYKQKLDYIHNNPVRQEIVQRPEESLYSSARDYCGNKGLLEVIVLP